VEVGGKVVVGLGADPRDVGASEDLVQPAEPEARGSGSDEQQRHPVVDDRGEQRRVDA
jgi:hypothetical protein